MNNVPKCSWLILKVNYISFFPDSEEVVKIYK